MSTIIEIVSHQSSTTVPVNGFVGVPAGGTAGQVLAKNSGTAYDVHWVDQGGNNPAVVGLYLAAENLSGHTPVVQTNAGVAKASSSTVSHASRVIGITLTSATTGTNVSVVTSGDLVEPTWNWVEGNPVFLSSNGTLTQTPPTTGFILQVGIALAPTKILVAIKFPIIL